MATYYLMTNAHCFRQGKSNLLCLNHSEKVAQQLRNILGSERNLSLNSVETTF